MKKIVLTVVTLLPCLVWGGPEEVRQAAERGDAEMQFELGELYEFGFGLQQNHVPALAWYMLAADQGHQQATKRRDMLKSRMSPQEIEQAQNQAQLLRRQSPPSNPVPAPKPVPMEKAGPPPLH